MPGTDGFAQCWDLIKCAEYKMMLIKYGRFFSIWAVMASWLDLKGQCKRGSMHHYRRCMLFLNFHDSRRRVFHGMVNIVKQIVVGFEYFSFISCIMVCMQEMLYFFGQ